MSEAQETFYQTLGLRSYASIDEVRIAYRSLVGRFHPDRNNDPAAVPVFQSITEAYRTLSDATKKSVYDAALRQLPSTDVRIPTLDDEVSHDAPSTRSAVFDAPPGRLLDVEDSGWSPRLRAIVAAGVVTLLACGALGYLYWPYLQSVGSPAVGQVFADCSGCPSMTVVPAGSFNMGSPEEGAPSWALPVHQVTIAAPFAIGRSEVTNQQFVDFLNDNLRNYDTRWITTDQMDSSSRILTRLGKFVVQSGYDSHPVVGVSWPGAVAYAQWLSDKTRRNYRLPSEAEWEYAARAGTDTKFYSGTDVRGLCEIGNVPDLARRKVHRNAGVYICEDGYAETAPVARFKPNAFGLYDTLGNATEFVQDCWHATYEGAPTDGSAWIAGGECQSRIVRGNNFSYFSGTGVAARAVVSTYRLTDVNGFRVVRQLN